MPSVRMKALKSMYDRFAREDGSEANDRVRGGTEFLARNEAIADEYEKRGLAVRVGGVAMVKTGLRGGAGRGTNQAATDGPLEGSPGGKTGEGVSVASLSRPGLVPPTKTTVASKVKPRSK